MDQLKTAMVTMSKRLKNSLNNVQGEISLKYKDLLVCRFLRKKKKMKRNIARIQQYEHRYEKSANRPVQFLRFIKTVHLPQIQDTPHLSQHCMLSLTQKINTGDMIELLGEIKITESGKQRQAGNEFLPTLMSSPVLQNSLTLTGVLGYTMYRLKDSSKLSSGEHTVNSDRELIYIDNHSNIRKVAADMKTTTLLIDKTYPEWDPFCVYCSPSSGDLLVGMCRNYAYYDTGIFKGKIIRYNNSCQPTQTIPQNNTPGNLYTRPRFITENNNGAVVVSDKMCKAVVVISGEGIHRFSYTGPPPSGSGLEPGGICTDALSNIILCDLTSGTVQLLSQNGEFLKYLLTNPSLGIDHFAPRGLSYDFYTHCLWVGSRSWDGYSMLSA